MGRSTCFHSIHSCQPLLRGVERREGREQEFMGIGGGGGGGGKGEKCGENEMIFP